MYQNIGGGPFETARREAKEELGIDIGSGCLTITGMGRPSDLMHFQILMKAELPEPMDDILKKARKSEEIGELIVPEDMEDFLRRAPAREWVPSGLRAVEMIQL